MEIQILANILKELVEIKTLLTKIEQKSCSNVEPKKTKLK